MILESDGLQDAFKEISKAHSVKEWISIAWRLGFFIVVLVYIKTILFTVKEILLSIWSAFVGKDKKLDTKELMGATMWLTTIGIVIKYFYKSVIDLEFFIVVVGYFCVMFGIEQFKNNKPNE